MKKVLILCLVLSLFREASAQTAGSGILGELMQTYQKQGRISFDVNYVCYEAGNPANRIDSMNGACIMDGMDYWYRLDETEMIQSGNYAIALFKDDLLMYITKRKIAGDSANRFSFPFMDSVLFQKVASIDTKKVGGSKMVTLQFKDSSSCKTLTMVLDSKTGLLQEIQLLMNARLLYEPEVQASLVGETKYAIVEVKYSNYRKGAPGDLLASGHFFQTVDGKFQPTAAYSQYKIFIGSPEL